MFKHDKASRTTTKIREFFQFCYVVGMCLEDTNKLNVLIRIVYKKQCTLTSSILFDEIRYRPN